MAPDNATPDNDSIDYRFEGTVKGIYHFVRILQHATLDEATAKCLAHIRGILPIDKHWKVSISDVNYDSVNYTWEMTWEAQLNLFPPAKPPQLVLNDSAYLVTHTETEQA